MFFEGFMELNTDYYLNKSPIRAKLTAVEFCDIASQAYLQATDCLNDRDIKRARNWLEYLQRMEAVANGRPYDYERLLDPDFYTAMKVIRLMREVFEKQMEAAKIVPQTHLTGAAASAPFHCFSNKIDYGPKIIKNILPEKIVVAALAEALAPNEGRGR
jgi:hypothetical protein